MMLEDAAIVAALETSLIEAIRSLNVTDGLLDAGETILGADHEAVRALREMLVREGIIVPRFVNKITIGFVIQKYDTETGLCVEQSFVAGDQVDYEDTDGTPVEWQEDNYQPFNMVQPERRTEFLHGSRLPEGWTKLDVLSLLVAYWTVEECQECLDEEFGVDCNTIDVPDNNATAWRTEVWNEIDEQRARNVKLKRVWGERNQR